MGYVIRHYGADPPWVFNDFTERVRVFESKKEAHVYIKLSAWKAGTRAEVDIYNPEYDYGPWQKWFNNGRKL